MTSKIAKLIATALGTGYAPKAPGTIGSIFGVLVFYFFNYILNHYLSEKIIIVTINFFLIIFTMIIGVWAINKVHSEWKHDSGRIVIDEVVGIFITLIAVPLDWKYYLTGLIVFRFFDILKPLMIKKIDELHTDWSVMLDDVLAGIYSLVVMMLYLGFS